MRLDFFARWPHFIDHMAPVWHAFPRELRGTFFVPKDLQEYAHIAGIDTFGLTPTDPAKPRVVGPQGTNPLYACAYKDLEYAWIRGKRKLILAEHGVGLTPATFPGYAGGKGGIRKYISLFLVPNQHTFDKNRAAAPNCVQEIVGVPKLDKWAEWQNSIGNARPKVAIAFHWDGGFISPEAGNAYTHYAGILSKLNEQYGFELLGHCHPRAEEFFRPIYEELGIQYTNSFDYVMVTADLYINDCSSTMYEFLVTGKPVIILNAPQFRRDLRGQIRFWEYTNIGIQVDQPHELLPAIDYTLTHPDANREHRERAVEDLYPNLGTAAQTAAEALANFVTENAIQRPRISIRKTEKIDGHEVGVLYMGFGQKAADGISQSINSMLRRGVNLPVAVIGDTRVPGTKLIPWDGEDPFAPDERHNFQFRAGRIKPYLYRLSPFEWNLYIDADTEFMSRLFVGGFNYLPHFDLAVAMEPDPKNLAQPHMISTLYNKPRAGWEINIKERNATLKEIGDRPFLNSGVLFFAINDRTKTFMEEWGKQWKRFQQWDEQLAFMRAIYKTDVRYKMLLPVWNHPHRSMARIIFHNYGRGNVRTNKERSNEESAS